MNLLLAVLWIFMVLSGCRQSTTPELRIEQKPADSVRTPTQALQEAASEAQVVTGVPATTSDGGTVPLTPEERPGAVAVKIDY